MRTNHPVNNLINGFVCVSSTRVLNTGSHKSRWEAIIATHRTTAVGRFVDVDRKILLY